MVARLVIRGFSTTAHLNFTILLSTGQTRSGGRPVFSCRKYLGKRLRLILKQPFLVPLEDLIAKMFRAADHRFKTREIAAVHRCNGIVKKQIHSVSYCTFEIGP